MIDLLFVFVKGRATEISPMDKSDWIEIVHFISNFPINKKVNTWIQFVKLYVFLLVKLSFI